LDTTSATAESKRFHREANVLLKKIMAKKEEEEEEEEEEEKIQQRLSKLS